MIKEKVDNLRKNGALVHNITNYVTVNDCANILLACGASPIMADDEQEVEDITSICDGLYINVGTLGSRTIPSMIKAGKKANELNHPVLLDPVGAGASKLRTQTCIDLINNINFSVIKGNISEIKTLALGQGNTKGVDADVADAVTDETVYNVIAFAKKFSEKTGAVIAITGAIDIVADSNKAYVIKNGNAMMGRITGAGCMLGALTTAYVASDNESIIDSVATAIITMGVAGEKAFSLLKDGEGNATFRNRLIDSIYNLNGEEVERSAKYEVR